MKIKVTSVYVDDQDKALRFYTEVLGFAKKTDFRQGPFRWLTVASPEEPDGTELQLALNDNPAAKAYQQAMFFQGQPAAMFYTDDVKVDYERIKGRGAEFTMPPTDVTGSPISLADGGLARGAGRHGAAASAERQPRGQSVSAGDVSSGPARGHVLHRRRQSRLRANQGPRCRVHHAAHRRDRLDQDRKSTRLNSS